MNDRKLYTAIGLMSGTSLDGVDAALLRTDGRACAEPAGFVTLPYEESLREEIRACFGLKDVNDPQAVKTTRAITLKHAEAVSALLVKTGCTKEDIDVIGFHGQTIWHKPEDGISVQIGDGALLARETGIDVVDDFRSADVAAGGQGAPLLPLYHAALAQGLPKPVAVLNIGGVANVTWLGPSDHLPDKNNEILAFDTGPGNALIDDFVKQRTGRCCDENGALAGAGVACRNVLDTMALSSYFDVSPPKSLDRNAWSLKGLENLSDEDGAATLTALTVLGVQKAQVHFPVLPGEWLVTGGGRHNSFLMEELQKTLEAPVCAVDEKGWNGDALEAQGFAYLAVRSLLGLPLSLPLTTGVKEPLTGGRLYKAAA